MVHGLTCHVRFDVGLCSCIHVFVYVQARTISLSEWVRALRGIGIVGVDFSERDAVRCFAWSLMAVSDAESTKGGRRACVRPFG